VAHDGRRLEAQGVRAALAALGALFLLVAPAVAAPDPGPLRVWSVSKVEQGLGKVPVAGDTQVFGVLDKTFDLGGVSLHPRGTTDRAREEVFSSADGARSFAAAVAPSLDTSHPGSAKGGVAHLDEYQAYVKRADDASLRIAISSVFLHAIDANGALQPPECPSALTCAPIRAIARFRVRAYAASGGFFDVGGAVYLEGYKGHWAVGAATASDARAPFWKAAQFDIEGSRTGSEASLELHRDDPLDPPEPVRLTVPLSSIGPGEQFAVHVSMEAEAIDDRGRESYASAFIKDPRRIEPGLRARGLEPRGCAALQGASGTAATRRSLSPRAAPARRDAAAQRARVRRRRGERYPDGAGHPHRRLARRDQRDRPHGRRRRAPGP
jgi:hypothetical protein